MTSADHPAPSQRRWLLATGAILGTLLYTLDSTIVNVALPHMAGSLQSTSDQIAWVVTSYIVFSAIATPLAGWLGTRYGLRRLLLGSVLGFIAFSALCGIASTLTMMVAFRALQGLCGAALVPLSQVALLENYPRERHGRVTALWGMGVLVGPILGPTLGGLLTEAASWRWAFYLNVPIGVVAYVGLLLGMPKDRGSRNRPFDLFGFLLLSLSLGLFQLMLDRGHTLDWFESPEIVAEAFFAAVCLYMFVVHMLTARHPFLDPQLFRDRNLVATLPLMFALSVAAFSPAVLLPVFLEQLQGYSPAQAGELLAVRGVSSLLAMFLAGRMVGRVDPRLMIGLGLGSSGLALWIMSGFSLGTPASHVALAGFVQGFSMPLAFVPLSVVAYATLHGAQRTEAGALSTLVRNMGSSIGIACTVAMIARSTQVNQSYLTEDFTAYSAGRWTALGIEAGTNTGTGALLFEIGRQAASIAYANVYFLLAVGSAAVLPLVLLITRRTLRGTRPDPADLPDSMSH